MGHRPLFLVTKRLTHMCAKWHTWRDRAARLVLLDCIFLGVVACPKIKGVDGFSLVSTADRGIMTQSKHVFVNYSSPYVQDATARFYLTLPVFRQRIIPSDWKTALYTRTYVPLALASGESVLHPFRWVVRFLGEKVDVDHARELKSRSSPCVLPADFPQQFVINSWDLSQMNFGFDDIWPNFNLELFLSGFQGLGCRDGGPLCCPSGFILGGGLGFHLPQSESGGFLRIHESPTSYFGVGGSGNGSIGAGLCGLRHLLKLSIVNTCNHDGSYQQESINYDQAYLAGSNVPFKFRGLIIFIVGAILGLISHFVLLWSRWRHWRLKTRLFWGISGWIVAVGLIWHGASLFLGID